MKHADLLWMDGKLITLDKAYVSVLSHVIHYGTGVFEGIRFYPHAQTGIPNIFCLLEHIQRLMYSARALKLKMPYTQQEITNAILQVITKNRLTEGYIRPFIFAGFNGSIGLHVTDHKVHTCIAAMEWPPFFEYKPIKLYISKVIRIHPASSDTQAKIAGHYVNSILACLNKPELYAKYDDALMLNEQGYIQEASAANVFFQLPNGDVITPTTQGILPGITRVRVIEYLQEQGICVIERDIHIQEIRQEDVSGLCCGTALEILPIDCIDEHIFTGDKTWIEDCAQNYKKIVTGQNPAYQRYLTQALDIDS